MANDGSAERRRSTRSGPAPAFAAAANKPVGSEHTQSKPLDLTGSTLRGASVKPADTDTGLFPAGTAVVHPQRGTGLVVEVHRQDGERKPWRVRYESGAVLRYPLAAMRKMTDNFFNGLRLEDRVISVTPESSHEPRRTQHAGVTTPVFEEALANTSLRGVDEAR